MQNLVRDASLLALRISCWCVIIDRNEDTQAENIIYDLYDTTEMHIFIVEDIEVRISFNISHNFINL